jgi:hypothetical protein
LATTSIGADPKEIKTIISPLTHTGSQKIQMQWTLLQLPEKLQQMLKKNSTARRDDALSVASKTT